MPTLNNSKKYASESLNLRSSWDSKSHIVLVFPKPICNRISPMTLIRSFRVEKLLFHCIPGSMTPHLIKLLSVFRGRGLSRTLPGNGRNFLYTLPNQFTVRDFARKGGEIRKVGKIKMPYLSVWNVMWKSCSVLIRLIF